MKFKNLISHIKLHHNRSIYFSTNKTSTSSFSTLSADVEMLSLALEKNGLPAHSRVGLIGDNSYAWLVWNIALVVNEYVPVIFSEDHFERSALELVNEYELWMLISDRQTHSDEKYVVDIQDYGIEKAITVCANGKVEGNTDILTLVFSSGTTGHMKGLVISRSGTEKIIQQFISAFDISSADKYFSFLPFSYFQQTALNYCALFCGVSISVVNSDKVLIELPKCSPTFIIAPPVFHQTIYKVSKMIEITTGENKIKAVLGDNIRFMITAMAPISPNIINYFWNGGVELYETFAVTETGMATWNTPKAYKIGTVGKASEDGTLIISSDGELRIKRSYPVSLGYFNTPSAISNETFLADGSVATGDIVEKDTDGFYRIIGRKKHAIITREGKKFHPEEIESIIKDKFNHITPVVYLSEADDQVSLLLFLSENSPSGFQDLMPKFKNDIQKINQALPNHKKIVSAFCTSQIPTWENGFLTRNLKLNRKNINTALINNNVPGLYQII